jgi:hypothetical protein
LRLRELKVKGKRGCQEGESEDSASEESAVKNQQRGSTIKRLKSRERHTHLRRLINR